MRKSLIRAITASALAFIIISGCKNSPAAPAVREMNFQYGVYPSSGYTGCADTTLAAYSSPAAYSYYNSGGSAMSLAGISSCGSVINRPVFRFDISSLPAGAEVQNASLILYSPGAAGCLEAAPVVSVYGLAADWEEGMAVDDFGVSGASWISKTASVVWAAPGGDFSPAAVSVSYTVNTAGYYDFGIDKALINTWRNTPSSNYGLILISNESDTISGRWFYTKEYTIPENRPRLKITYIIP